MSFDTRNITSKALFYIFVYILQIVQFNSALYEILILFMQWVLTIP